MVGITSYGAYVPWNRLQRKSIFQAMGWYAPFTYGVAKGEKAICNYDEDSLSMAVNAGMNCVNGLDTSKIGCLNLASTTLPYDERMNASIVATALDLKPEVCAADITGGLKSGTTAMIGAIDSVKAGSSESALVCMTDSRLGKPGSAYEHIFGDAAASFLIGSEDVIAEFKGSYSISCDFADLRRANGDSFVRNWEERWIRDEGISKVIPQAIMGAATKYGIQPSEISKICIGLPSNMSAMGKKIMIEPEKFQDPMVGVIGDCGAALAGIMLVAALEDAAPGDKIVVVSFGSGADVLLFEVTDAIKSLSARKAVKACLANRKELDSYEKYTTWRNISPLEVGIRAEAPAPTALTALWRDKGAILGLVGSECTECGTRQYPPQRICVNPACKTQDKMKPYRFSDKKGKLFTFTGDNLAFSYDPPSIYGLVDMDEGGRLWMDFTDVAIKDMIVDMDVEFSFRRKYLDPGRGVAGYTWKAVPASVAKEVE
ncbi:MAG TPA: OB-fold domain-containing protein [bacterium]|nr:OB-fold domain-containing protein [bacterium]